MNSVDNRGSRAAQFDGAAPLKCLVCGDPIGDRCFCKIHRKEEGPILLCCPTCTLQYIDSTPPAAEDREQDLRAYEKITPFFVGDGKPWL